MEGGIGSATATPDEQELDSAGGVDGEEGVVSPGVEKESRPGVGAEGISVAGMGDGEGALVMAVGEDQSGKGGKCLRRTARRGTVCAASALEILYFQGERMSGVDVLFEVMGQERRGRTVAPSPTKGKVCASVAGWTEERPDDYGPARSWPKSARSRSSRSDNASVPALWCCG